MRALRYGEILVFSMFFFMLVTLSAVVILWRSEITVGNIGELGGGTTKRGDKAGLNIG